jgi:two-component system LytT family response regulator
MRNQEKIVTSKPLNNYKNLLANFGFVQTHRSHIINPNYVVGYNKEQSEINLEGNISIPLSRRKKNDILEALFSIE